jgi:hypothetical protein
MPKNLRALTQRTLSTDSDGSDESRSRVMRTGSTNFGVRVIRSDEEFVIARELHHKRQHPLFGISRLRRSAGSRARQLLRVSYG